MLPELSSWELDTNSICDSFSLVAMINDNFLIIKYVVEYPLHCQSFLELFQYTVYLLSSVNCICLVKDDSHKNSWSLFLNEI